MSKLAKLLIYTSFLLILSAYLAILIYTFGFLLGQDQMAATWMDGCLKGDVNLEIDGILVHCGVVKAL